MRRYLVIGLGNFGSWTAKALTAQGHEVIAVEKHEGLVDRFRDSATRCIVGDATDVRLLREIDAQNVDAAIVSTGDDLASSILITLALADLGIEELYVKVNSPEAARVLEALRVRETVFPEREAAYNLAHRLGSHVVLKYMSLSPGYSIQEVAIPDAWLGKTLRELQLPQHHGVQVVAVYDVLTEKLWVVPDPDRPLKESDIAIVAGNDDVVAQILGESKR